MSQTGLIPTIRQEARDVFRYWVARMGLSDTIKLRDYSG